jgi:tetratricopeptide (TPR) repeat protein/2-polyprenyl-3-methyl-5-hydroxy-6-metoxy-1,4-benzoquinol methylase
VARRDGRKGRRALAHTSAAISGGDAQALLPLALAHHQNGDFERARTLYEQLIAAQPEHADGLQYFGILCHQCGDPTRAESLIRLAISHKPDVALYYDNLGTVLEHNGRFDEALSAYEAAERLEPGDIDRAYNLGVVLEHLGQARQAEQRYGQVLEQRPDDVDCQFALAKVCKARGALDEAIAIYRRILTLDVGHNASRINLANVLQDRGEIEQALAQYRSVLSRDDLNVLDAAAAYHNQGRALLRADHVSEAQISFEQALHRDPKLVDARLGLAQALERQGLFDRAYAAYRAVCVSEAADAHALSALLRVARVLAPARHDEFLVTSLLSAIEAGTASASNFARALGQQLAAKADLYNAPLSDDADALQRAVQLQLDPLFVLALERCVNIVPAIERWLCAVRRALLHADTQQLVGKEPVLRALALQCAANEYVYPVSDAEVGVVDAVLAQLEGHTSSALLDSEDSVRDLLLCACYTPLTQLWGALLMAQVDASELGPWLAAIVQRAVSEPLREKALAATIPSLGPIDDPSSKIVRAQYEENPYPRWREMPPLLAVDLEHGDGYGCGYGYGYGDRIAKALATAPDASILVAGCGTGYEPLTLAKRYPGHRVLAMDLSLASLAYAARMAEELGLHTLEFVHGDLLQVDSVQHKFEVITASGVLHHLAQPLLGWRALSRCLTAHGVMKIALYSRRARSAINIARERVAVLGLPASEHGVRALRARILAGDEVGLESLLDSEDFYTTSVCRDLIFHPLEHQFDLGEVATMLDALGLQFDGFDLPHPLVRRQFLAAQLGEETDLCAWDRFERSNPQTFEAMYVMWCRKKVQANVECNDD